MLALGKEQERFICPIEEALRLREKNLSHEKFESIPGTCACQPKLEHIRALAPYDILPGMGMAPYSFDRIEVMPLKARYFVHRSQISSPQREKIVRLKIYFQKHYSSWPRLYETPEDYEKLTEEQQARIIDEDQCQRAFAMAYIFGDPNEFACVAHKYNGNPFKIAESFDVPATYVMYEISLLGAFKTHFIMGSNGAPKVIKTHESNDKALFLKSKIREPGNDLLASTLWRVPSEYYDKWIYKFSVLGNSDLLCLGKILEKKDGKRMYVFGIPREFVDQDLLRYLESEGLSLKSALS